MGKKKTFEPHYRVFTNNTNLVKVGCSYAGRMYYGEAKCAPEDTFDYDFGYKLAKARCDYAICTAKMLRSQELLSEYRTILSTVSQWVRDEEEYEGNLHLKWLEAEKHLMTILEES